MRQRNWRALTWPLAFGAAFVVANASYGEDKDSRSNSSKASNASRDDEDASNKSESGDQAANRDQDRDRDGDKDRDQDRQSGRDQSRRAGDQDVHHHGALGVSLKEADGRVTVIAIAPGSPAANAGLRVGDEIRNVGDQRIRTAHGLTEEIGDYRPGSKAELTIVRNGERKTLEATIGSHDAVFRSESQAGGMQANRGGRTSYSYGPNQAAAQQVQRLQQQVSQLQREINNLQSQMGRPMGNQSGGYGGQQAVYGGQGGGSSSGRPTTYYQFGRPEYYGYGQPPGMVDRTNLRYSSPRGYSRDHGPRETVSGNTAPEE